MSISLIKEREEKVTISLKKRTNRVIQAKQVNLILDVSGSMVNAYARGNVQEILERILPIATKFTPEQRLNVWIFSTGCKKLIPVDVNNYQGYTFKEIVNKGNLGGGTNYAPVIRSILDENRCPPKGFWESVRAFFGLKDKKEAPKAKLPILNIMITDGSNDDKYQTQDLIIEASDYPLFWQFCGTYSLNFPFLEKLDNLHGRTVDNANFFQVNDIANITDDELYDRLLGEFPTWIDLATKEGILS